MCWLSYPYLLRLLLVSSPSDIHNITHDFQTMMMTTIMMTIM